MEKLVVHGGFTLRGAVNISGSKNASYFGRIPADG